MVRLANTYFDAIEQQNGDIIALTDECVRIENGVRSTSNPPDPELDARQPWRTLNIRDQLNAKYFAYIGRIRDRRFPIVDEQRGVVLCHAMFDHPGNLEISGGVVPFGYPCSALVFEAFKIEGGLISHVEALVTLFPYGMRTGWDEEAEKAGL
jgi:hypothetical protein